MKRIIFIITLLLLSMTGGYSLDDSNLVSWYKLYGDADDSTGLNNCTNSGVDFSGGNYGYFSATQSDFIDCDSLVNDINTDTVGAVAVWVRADVNNVNFNGIFSVADKGTGNDRMRISVDTGSISGRLRSGGIWDILISGDSSPIAINTDYHIVFTQDGTTSTVYINGVAQADTDSGEWFNDMSGLDNAVIGTDADTEAYDWDGDIWDLSIFNDSLSLADVTQLYNGGSYYTYEDLVTNTTPLSVNILSIEANGNTFINNTIFTVSDLIFNVTYEVNNSDVGNFTNSSITSLLNQPNSLYYTQFEVCYNSTCDTSDNYTYTVNVTTSLTVENVTLNDITHTTELINKLFFNNTDVGNLTVFLDAVDINESTAKSKYRIYKYSSGTWGLINSNFIIFNAMNGTTDNFGGLSLLDAPYYYWLETYNDDGIGENSSNYYFTIDTIAPAIKNSMGSKTVYDYIFDSEGFSCVPGFPSPICGFTNTYCTDANLDECYINISNTITNLTDTKIYFNSTYNGNMDYTIYGSDLAGNKATSTGSILVSPYQYFRFYDDKNSVYISNFTFGSYASEDGYAKIPVYDLGLGTHSLQFKSQGFSNEDFSFTFNTTSALNLSFNVSTVKINVNVYYRVNGSLFDKAANVLILDLLNSTTSNGTLIFENSSFSADTYTIQASSPGYYTEQKVFTYTSEDTVDISLYLLNETGLTSSTLQVSVQDELYNKIPNSNTKLLEYDNAILGFKEISQCYTNSIGQCEFLVELGDKTYKIISSITLDGITYEAISTPDGEIFQPLIINGEEVAIGLIERDLTLKITGRYDINYLNGLYITAPNNEQETIKFENDTIKIINLPVTWDSINNLDYDICLNFYYINQGNKLNFTSPICGVGSSGILASDNLSLDNTFDYQVEISILYDGETTIYKTYNYKGEESLNALFEELAIVSPVILALWIGLLSLALWSKKIIIFGGGAFFISAITVIMFPNYLVGAGVVMIDLIGLGIIHMARVERDLI